MTVIFTNNNKVFLVKTLSGFFAFSKEIIPPREYRESQDAKYNKSDIFEGTVIDKFIPCLVLRLKNWISMSVRSIVDEKKSTGFRL